MWNYRLVEISYPTGGTEVAIYTVFYNDDKLINGWSSEPSRMIAHDKEDMRAELERHKMALDKPMLKFVVDSDGKESLIPHEEVANSEHK